jgi:uncharacterized membrane protein
MALRLIESTARAFGMLVFIVVSLWLTNSAFPRNWLLLAALYVALIPVALLYGWLTALRTIEGSASTRPRLPPLLVVGVGAAIAIVGYLLFASEINAAFYPASVHEDAA